jgi:hypothetical protein
LTSTSTATTFHGGVRPKIVAYNSTSRTTPPPDPLGSEGFGTLPTSRLPTVIGGFAPATTAVKSRNASRQALLLTAGGAGAMALSLSAGAGSCTSVR